MLADNGAVESVVFGEGSVLQSLGCGDGLLGWGTFAGGPGGRGDEGGGGDLYRREW
jgi:hypothetical protein